MILNKLNIHFDRSDILKVILISCSALIYSIGFVTFVQPANLFPGGFSGISRLLSEVLKQFANIQISFSVIYMAMNVITTLFIWKKIGHKFVLYSILWYTLTSYLTSVLPAINITYDPILLCIFGGLINGLAIGISLRNNASSGGTDFIAIYMSMRYNVSTWNYVLGANAVILVIAGLIFGWDRALYSIIFQYVSTQVVQTLHHRYKLTQINVVTNNPDEICQSVFHICRHGITKIQCEGGFTDQIHWMLVMTINTYQLKEVVDTIKAADEHAFVTLSHVDRIIGNYYQKPLE